MSVQQEERATVIIVDDDGVVLESLRYLFESVDLDVRTYSSADELLEKFQPPGIGCVLLDMRMPGRSGFDVQEQLTALGCHLPVIIVTAHADVAMCRRAFKAGAYDFIEKPVNHQVLLDSVHGALQQLPRTLPSGNSPRDVRHRLNTLTDREREVMDLLVAGKLTKSIALILGITVKTAARHRANVFDKMNASGEAELVHMALSIQQFDAHE